MTRQEDQASAADLARQERAGASARNVGMISPGFVHIWNHPDHGEQVIFTPGELLPPWAAARLLAAGGESRPGDLTVTVR